MTGALRITRLSNLDRNGIGVHKVVSSLVAAASILRIADTPLDCLRRRCLFPGIEKIWHRLTRESRPPFHLRMEDRDFTVIDLYGGPGGGHIPRSDGVVAKWDLDST